MEGLIDLTNVLKKTEFIKSILYDLPKLTFYHILKQIEIIKKEKMMIKKKQIMI